MNLVVRTLLGGLLRVVRAHPYATAWVVGSFFVGAVDSARLNEAYMIADASIFLSTIPLGIVLRRAYYKSPEVQAAMGPHGFPPVLWNTGVLSFALSPHMAAGSLTAAPARRFVGAFAACIFGMAAALFAGASI